MQCELVGCRACFCPGPCEVTLSPLPYLPSVSAGSLPAGEHSFPFQFLLPGEHPAWPGQVVAVGEGGWEAGWRAVGYQSLLSPATAPTSFEGPFGKIVHQVRATIDTPRFSKDHQCSRVFYILSPLNLNSIPDIEVSLGSGLLRGPTLA